MKWLEWATKSSGTARVVTASALLALGLIAVVWASNQATRRELLSLLRAQAVSLRQTVAAAARSNLEASTEAASELESRMLDSARLLAELDRRGLLDEEFLGDVARRDQLFRVSVFGPDRQPEFTSGSAGPRRGFGPGFASGRGGRLLDELLAGEGKEEVTDIHVSRWGDWRGFAAVRRHRGGAIVLNMDASAVEGFRRQTSLDALLADITESAEEVAYTIFEQDGIRIAHGEVPPEGALEPTIWSDRGPTALSERELEVQGQSVLEFSGPILLDRNATASLRLGMRLEGVHQAEQRMLWQLALSLGTSLALAVLGVGTVWLQRKYSLLSERHARAEEALRRRDRLAAMGELSSTVAHEIRNPLNAIAMSAKRLRREFVESVQLSDEDREEVEELLGVLEGETGRINDRVQQFLDFARPPRLAPRRIHLGTLAGQVADGARALAATRGVSLETHVSEAGEAVVDPGQLRQALENIVRNAMEATPEGGRVAIAVRSRPQGHELEVIDTGHGIDSKDLPRLFDLYFTTKKAGTGVGLAVTQQIVTAHGGTIEVESQRGRGTRMTVKLPGALEKASDA